ncbi:SDR family NAD(P)-dependent oxidoreductase [Nocardioides alcanivorans]|uniref:SDR family NAD(P)-dependent oxidoreductase n=1 Tax=Nocardioides alcanivorans TaxID=2897352 RepID=UPI001F1BEE25|nr:SDR family oxidoreductase [Nocardioides alcanivorans]
MTEQVFSPSVLTGRTALVTGAGQGVGRGIAERLAEAGARVLVNDLDAERAGRVADSLVARDLLAEPLPFDVTDHALVTSTLAGREIDVFVNNAGVPPGGGRPNRFAEMPAEDWQLQLSLNLEALMHLTQTVLPGQVERGRGRIIQISSGASARGLAIGVAAYGAAKAGGESLIRHLAVEYGPLGITANSLALGLMEGVARGNEERIAKMARAIPTGRLGNPREVGTAVVWLASDDGGLINGQVIHLNGGTIFGR